MNPLKTILAKMPWLTSKAPARLPELRVLAENLPHILEQSLALARIYGERMTRGDLLDAKAIERASAPFLDMTRAWMRDPKKLLGTQLAFWRSYSDLLFATWQRAAGAQVEPVIEPEAGDRRFTDKDWAENPLFDFIKQSYLLFAHALLEVAEVEGQDPQDAKKRAFFAEQLAEAVAPSNFLLSNPVVVRATLESGGENLVRGLKNLLDDLVQNQGHFRVSQTDRSAFVLGQDIATTPGKVVFQNDLIQLIQYQPTTETVHQRPLLMVPPWINKYYILDLQAHNSFVKWVVDQGFTVFMVSWVNPDERLAHKGFDDYLNEGVLHAIDAVEAATGEREVNILSYCIGGILMGSGLAHMAQTGDDRVKSATFLTTLLDFSEVGDVDVFINEEDFAHIESAMDEKGYFEAERMADTFNMIRSRDLIWAYVVKNYLLGQDPAPFDMLYWATDNTRLPARMHKFYLRNYYLHNRLCQPGAIRLLDTDLDLGKVEVPAYFLSTEADHIAPWKSTYRGACLLGGPTEFVLAGSGHIAGVINPAGSKKYGYRTGDELADTPEAWLERARQNPGSWWSHWRAWLSGFAGPQVPARVPGTGAARALEDAPGSYVRG